MDQGKVDMSAGDWIITVMSFLMMAGVVVGAAAMAYREGER